MAEGAICFIPPIQNSRNKAYSAFAHLSNTFPFCWGPTPYICSFIAQLVIVNKLAHVTAHFLFPIWYDLISFLPLSEHVFVEGPWRGELQRAHASILGISSVPSFPASHLSHVLYGYIEDDISLSPNEILARVPWMNRIGYSLPQKLSFATPKPNGFALQMYRIGLPIIYHLSSIPLLALVSSQGSHGLINPGVWENYDLHG